MQWPNQAVESDWLLSTRAKFSEVKNRFIIVNVVAINTPAPHRRRWADKNLNHEGIKNGKEL